MLYKKHRVGFYLPESRLSKFHVSTPNKVLLYSDIQQASNENVREYPLGSRTLLEDR